MADRTKRQHVVSRFYLSNFASDRRQLIRTDLATARESLVSVDDATVVKDYYSVVGPHGRLSDFFEKQFAQIEGPAATAIRLLLDNRAPGLLSPFHPEQKRAMSVWIALQYLRSEGVRQSQTEMNGQIIQILVGASGKAALRDHIERHEGTAITGARLDAEWRDLTKAGGPTLVGDVVAHLQMLTSLLGPTAAMIANMQWSVAVYCRRRIMTGDHPVSLLQRVGGGRDEPIGLATAGGILVPLSRSTVLSIGASPGLPDLRVPGTTVLARSTNSATANSARRAVYWSPADVEYFRAVSLPRVRGVGLASSASDYFVREDGLFANTEPDKESSAERLAEHESDEGFTLTDLPWPIPNRVSNGGDDERPGSA